MSERTTPSGPEPQGRTCQWCHGSGYGTRALAYCPGADPFTGPADTVHRAGECAHCRGTGEYDSALDPTLGHPREAGEGSAEEPDD
ncbi:hypothetical protein [Streptomyces sp. UNOB3_S3]|uniref:hypothetical protein n=1 Tax=Streptomyces sp. UNOB3_S3 TaxID=2871682 RepID=UPI001E50CB34|nr:hypothetical protein [Streptomyces sp. UNOB3_S3]MCC3778865.1 hypothetical protein [Streptomyces sp. UNOB3_S3]